MTDGEVTFPIAPLVADSAPRLNLVAQSSSRGGMKIACRRIVTLLGARPGCKINLPHPSVSPVHLAIVNNGAQIIAADLLSRRGTKLNDLKMEHEVLNHGDQFTLDLWKFRVEILQGKTADHEDAHPFELDQTPHAVALEHLDSGRVLQLNREICVIGRRGACDIHIDDDRVSRVHALLLTYYGHPAICDLLSKTGTLVNNEPVTYRTLKDMDVLGIGEAQFRVRLVVSKVGEQTPKQLEAPQHDVEPEPDDTASDLIDIQAVEGSQRWQVAESLEKASRKA